MDRKNNISETRKYFMRVGKEQEKLHFPRRAFVICKVVAKILARKLILRELLRLNFKPKNNIIKRKRFWVR